MDLLLVDPKQRRQWFMVLWALLVLFFVSFYLVIREARVSGKWAERVSGSLALRIAEKFKSSTLDYRGVVLAALEGSGFKAAHEDNPNPGVIQLVKSGSQVGRVILGHWHFEHSSLTAPHDSCYERGRPHSSESFRPCFVGLKAAKEEALPTAARVEIREGGLVHVATAALKPKRILIMLDLGPRVVSASGGGDGADYVVELRDGIRCGNEVSPNIDRILVEQRGKFSSQVALLSDYECSDLQYESLRTRIPLEKSFLLQKQNRPQPLADILSSINSFMKWFDALGVSGDRFGFLGFDNENLPLRATGGEKDFGFVPADLSDSEYAQFFRATGVFKDPVRINNFDDYVGRMLFPRRTSDILRPDKHGKWKPVKIASDISHAIDRASLMFSQDNHQWSFDDSVVLITAGRSTCRHPGDCRETKNYLRNSTERAKRQLYTLAREQGITVDIVLYDDLALPQSRLLSRGKSSCSGLNDCCLTALDYSEFGRNLPDIVVPDELSAEDSYAPRWLSYPNVWAFVSSLSGGLWSPVRPACSEFALSKGANKQLVGLFENLCRKGTEFGQVVLPSGHQSELWKYFGRKMYRVLGDAGQLYCDPSGLSRQEQIKEALKQRVALSRGVVLVDKISVAGGFQ